MRQDRWRHSNSRPYNPVWVTHKQDDNYNLRFSLKSSGSIPQTRVPSPGIIHQENEPQEYMLLKASWAHFQENKRALGHRDSTIIGQTKFHTF